MIQFAVFAVRIAEQIDVDAVLAALEIQVDQSPGASAAAACGGEQRLVRANLFAHDDDLVPLAGGSPVAGRFQALRGLQERVLVAPDEIDFKQLQAQIAPVRFALERNSHEVGCLIIQTVCHVKIGFGQRIALIEIDRTLARHRVVGSFDIGVRIAQPIGILEIRDSVFAGLLDHE